MISVIIPVYNERKNLESLLPYLNKIKSNDLVEVIIAVSSADTHIYDDLVFHPNMSIIKCEGKGRALQMNEGAKNATGEIFAFLHADVIPPRGFFDDIGKTIANSYEAGFFSYQFDKDSFFLRINAFFTTREGIFTGGGDQCLFIKKSVFERLRGFDEQQVLMEDFEFFKRMKKQKVKYTIIKNDLTVSARKYDSNSYLRINLTNLLLFALFKVGASPQRLKNIHQKLLSLPY